ncbi:hypothetical protein QBC36DRAFT_82851 [Triangularia setosa]|uniref:Uncharacterized protein n=1 Tax=Triangularia setosa TaxID=2587417 RepID=A0AAN6VZ93_9PEZI|nr:hypothetical protein QBC36DRAFT_82851 [Podospora setosa]
MKHTTALVAAIGLAATVSAANPATDNRRNAVNRRSVPVSAPRNMKRETTHQQGSKRVEPRSPIRYAFPGPRDEDKDQATDAVYDIGSGYLEDQTGIRLPDSGSSGSGGRFPRSSNNRKRSVIEPRQRSRGGSGRGGGFKDAVKDAVIDEGTGYLEDQTGIDLPDRNGQSSSGSSGGGWSSWRPWRNRKREITVDEVVEEVLDKMNEGGSKSDDDTVDALKEVVNDATENNDDTSISEVVEALTDAGEDGDSKSNDDSTDTVEEILDAISSEDSDDKDKDEESLAEKIEDLVDGGPSDSKSSHGNTLEEKLEELEKETSGLDKDDPKAVMIDQLIDELIDDAATLDEIPVEYFQYWMAVQSCLDPVHSLTTKGLMASHLSRRGTTPIVVTPTKTVKREEKLAEVKLGLAQPFGVEMAQTSGALDVSLGQGTVGYLVVGVAAAFLVGGVAF